MAAQVATSRGGNGVWRIAFFGATCVALLVAHFARHKEPSRIIPKQNVVMRGTTPPTKPEDPEDNVHSWTHQGM